jgi:single-strand DNA-binding protein
MSAVLNQSLLFGGLVAQPERLTTKVGKLLIKAAIAVSVHRKSQEGNDERTSFLPVTLFGKLAETFLKYVQTADMVLIIGRLDSSEWNGSDAKKNLSLNFVAKSLQLLPNQGKPIPR